MYKSRFISIILTLLLTITGYGQVYNYSSLGYYNIETNPTVLTSAKTDGTINLIQKNSFSTNNPFSYSSVRYSQKLSTHYLGAGIMMNHTNTGNGEYYSHVGLGLGYHNVFFNTVYLKIGATYKVIQSNKPGSFDYFSYSPTSIPQNKLSDNINLAFSITGESELFHLSVSALNIDLPWNETEEVRQFPKYYLLNVGNFLSLFGIIESKEISYTAMSKFDSEKQAWVLSHYLNLRFYQLSNTRRVTTQFGTKIGLLEQQYYHFIPFVTVYGEKWFVNLQYNFHLDKVDFKREILSTIQLSLLYKIN